MLMSGVPGGCDDSWSAAPVRACHWEPESDSPPPPVWARLSTMMQQSPADPHSLTSLIIGETLVWHCTQSQGRVNVNKSQLFSRPVSTTIAFL